MSRIPLKKHQVAQKSAFRRWVGFPARSSVPPQGARGTIVSATGSGKTIMAAASALECFPEGRILVTVPTLDLLVQTAQAWRLVGHRAPMVAGRLVLEASGGITLETAAEVAESGVDYLSSGAITHSAPNLDVALDIEM